MRRLSLTIRDKLAQKISSGVIAPGARLPTEPDLAAEMGVSRATLREALRSLEEDGFVSRRRGAGTYATHRPRLRNNLDVNFGVTAMIRAAGMTPGTQRARTSQEQADADEAHALDLDPGDPISVLDRVRTADERPVVFSRDVVPSVRIGIRALEAIGDGSIYDLLARAARGAGGAVEHGIVSIEPSRADRFLAKALEIKVGAPLLYLRQVDYDREGTPLLLSHEHHVADAFEFSVVRRGPGQRGTKGSP